MNGSVNIPQLRRRAKRLSKETGKTHSEALRDVAIQAGFPSWERLMREASPTNGLFSGGSPQTKAEGMSQSNARRSERFAASSSTLVPSSQRRAPVVTYKKRRKVVLPEGADNDG